MTGPKAAKKGPTNIKRSQRAKHKVEEAGAEVHRLEAEMAELTKLNGDLEHRNSILETYLELQESPKAGRQAADNEWWLDAETRAFMAAAFEPGQTITFSVCESRPLTLTYSEVANMPEEQYWMLFKMFVDAFSACLMASKGQYVRGTPLATRLQRLCFECGALRTIFAYAHPSRCLSMMSVRPPAERCTLRRNADNWSAGFDIPGCLPSVHLCCLHARIGDLQHEVFVDPQCVLPHYVVLQTHTSFWCAKECVACNELFPQYLHAYVGIHVSWQAAASGTTVEQSREVWRDILKSIQLTREQRTQLLELRRRFLVRCSVILKDRQEIAKKLEAIYPHGEGNHQSAFQYLETTNATEALQRNLCAELAVNIQFQVVLWKNCVNSMQAAIMFSKCSPHYNLDLIQLTNLIAEEEGAPSVADIIGQPLVAAGGGEDLLTIQVRDTTLTDFQVLGALPGRWEDVPGGAKPRAGSPADVQGPATPGPK